jgi:hypothetical protein
MIRLNFRRQLTLLAFALVAPVLLYAQNPATSIAVKPGHHETAPSAAKIKKQTATFNNVTSVAPGITDHNDVPVDTSRDDQAEVHMSINPNNPSVLAVSFNTWVTFNKVGTPTQSHFVSTNGGATWSGSELYNSTSPTVDGDPSTAIDANGNIFISTINSNDNGYYIIKSTNNSTFGSPVSGIIDPGFDKEMIAVDNLNTSPYKNNFYCAWTAFTNPNGYPVVRFNRSTDGGNTFSSFLTLKNGPGQGTNVQTGPNGEVYVCYADYGAGPNITFPASGLGFTKSTDGGVTFSAPQVVVPYVGIRKSNVGDPAFNNIRVNDYPSMAVDKSSGPHRGRIYAVFAAQQNGNGKAVVELTYSDNQGSSWSSPQVISFGAAIQSFFPWITVDPADGTLVVAYYSIDAANFVTDTYVAISGDGGNTIVTQRVSDVPHITQPIAGAQYAAGYEGDYIGVVAQGGKAYVGWMDERNGPWQVFVSEVDYPTAPTITGTSAFCTSSTLTASSEPAGTVITWSASPTGVVSLSPSGYQVTATKVSSGSTTLKAAVVTGAAGSKTLTTYPIITAISAQMSGACSNGYQSWYVSATTNGIPASSWLWTAPTGTTSTFIIQSPNSQSTYITVKGGGTPQVHYTDVCGDVSANAGVTIYSPCTGAAAVMIYPNPATTQLTIQNGNITSPSNVAASDQTNLASQAYSVQLLDVNGKVVKTGQNVNGGQNVTLSTGDLLGGTYYLHIFQPGQDTIEKQVIIQR